MKKIIEYIKNNTRTLILKSAVLLSFIAVFTTTDLIVKHVVYKNLRTESDVVVIPRFWEYHYQTNDDIGFSALRWINKYFGVPEKINKEKYEKKVIEKLDINYEKILIGNYYKLDKDNKYYLLEKSIDENDKTIIKDILSTAGYKTSKWLFLVILQGLGSIVVIIFYYASGQWRHLIPLALIVSGAFGNVIDRIIRGFVVDYVMWNFWFFPDWKIFNNFFKPWPIFNLADVFTVTGALSLFIIMFFFTEDEESKLDS